MCVCVCVHLKPVSTARLGFNENISSAFQVIPKLYAHFTKLCLAVFFFFFFGGGGGVIFGNVREEIVFLKGLVQFGEIRNIKD